MGFLSNNHLKDILPYFQHFSPDKLFGRIRGQDIVDLVLPPKTSSSGQPVWENMASQGREPTTSRLMGSISMSLLCRDTDRKPLLPAAAGFEGALIWVHGGSEAFVLAMRLANTLRPDKFQGLDIAKKSETAIGRVPSAVSTAYCLPLTANDFSTDC